MPALTRVTITLLAISLSPILNASSVEFLTQELPLAVVGMPYDEKIETNIDGQCPRGDIGLAVFGGELPRGIEIAGERLVGTPKIKGTYPVTIRASNSCGFEVKGYQLIVTDKPVLEVSPSELHFVYRDLYATPHPQSLLVSSTWPGVEYFVEKTDPEDDRWLSFHRRGLTPGQDSGAVSDVVAVRVDVADLKPGVYRSTLTLSTPAFPSVTTVLVTLTVEP